MSESKHCSLCNREITPEEWESLPCIGIQRWTEEDGEHALEMRNDKCGTTLCIEVTP